METKKWMRISELERVSGVPRSTIHFYLRKGILHSPIKTGQTMAYYDSSHLERLKTIQKMKMNMRLPTAFIKQQLDETAKIAGSAKTVTSNSSLDPKMDAKKKRKRQIIEAAVKLFSTKGYHRTNIRDITEVLGISTGTFYIYFPNKGEIFIEVIDDVIRNIVGEIAKAIRKEKDFLKRATLRAQVFFDNYPIYSEILNQLQAEKTADEQWPREKVKKIYRDLTEPLVREARKAMEQGIIRKIDPELLAFCLIGLVDIMSNRIRMDNKYAFDTVIAFMIDLMMNGLTPALNKRKKELSH